MAIYLPNSTFLHIPKTGGTYVRTVLSKLGLYNPKNGSQESGFDDMSKLHRAHMSYCAVECDIMERNNITMPLDEKPIIQNPWCVVRDPVAWYLSLFQHRQRQNEWAVPGDAWPNGAVLEEIYVHTDGYFTPWVEGITKEFPGMLYNLYRLYIPELSDNKGFNVIVLPLDQLTFFLTLALYQLELQTWTDVRRTIDLTQIPNESYSKMLLDKGNPNRASIEASEEEVYTHFLGPYNLLRQLDALVNFNLH